MSGKLRKSLGSRDTLCVLDFTQALSEVDKHTAVRWALLEAASLVLPIYMRACPSDERLEATLQAAHDWLDGKVKLPFVKNLILNAAHQAAREAKGRPAAQAAARACAQAASGIHAKGHVLGIIHYGAAALAYEALGLEALKEEYTRFFEEFCVQMRQSLQAYAANVKGREDEQQEF